MINKILVPVDGSQNSMKALRMALEMAEKFNAKLAVLSVAVQKPIGDVVLVGLKEERDFVREAMAAAMTDAKSVLEAAENLIAAAKLEAEFEVKAGEPADVILTEALDKNADCIVMGCRGLSGLEQFLLGSVSNKVVNHANIPVFVVK